MKHLRQFFYVGCCLVLLFSCVLIGRLHAESGNIIISEVKIKNDTAGYDEYIELYNPTPESVALNTLYIGYLNSATPAVGQIFSRYVIAEGLLEPGNYLLLAKNNTNAHMPLSQISPFSSLSDGSGTIQITDEAGVVLDQVSWTATSPLAVNGVIYAPGTTASKSQSLTRSRASDGTYQIAPAVWEQSIPSPASSNLLPFPPEVNVVDDVPLQGGTQLDTPDSSESQTADERVAITEVLPNPAAPQTDEADEYIELHNQSPEPINLKGYKLQSGNNFTYSYEFPEHNLEPDKYEAFMVSDTHLLLSNTSGKSRLLNSQGQVIFQTESYNAAPAGQAWALIEDVWQWTDKPTPGSVNQASASGVMNKSTTKAATKVAVVKAAKTTKTTPKPSKTATSKGKTSTTTKKSAESNKKGKGEASKVPPVIHPFILAGVGVSTILYGSYEYRQDIINLLRRLRSDRSLGGKVRRAIPGPGGD